MYMRDNPYIHSYISWIKQTKLVITINMQGLKQLVKKMLEPRRLTNLWAPMACYRDSCSLILLQGIWQTVYNRFLRVRQIFIFIFTRIIESVLDESALGECLLLCIQWKRFKVAYLCVLYVGDRIKRNSRRIIR
jgi:hypothetical protein